jgi:hypothetical protein
MENKWIMEIIKRSSGYKKIVCPYLKNNKCIIYKERFNCCRKFPVKNGYCAKSNCQLLKKNIKNNTKKSSLVCSECKKICCKSILVPDNIEITKKFIEKWMNIDCDTCKKLFK